MIVDIDIKLGGKKVRETRVGKIQHKPGTSDECDEVVNKSQINGADRANGLSSNEKRAEHGSV